MYDKLKNEIYKEFDKNKNYNTVIYKANKKIKITLSSICAVIMVAVGITSAYILNHKKISNENFYNLQWQKEQAYSDSSGIETDTQLTVLPHWDKLSNEQRYYTLKYNNIQYDSAVTEIATNKVGEYIDEEKLTKIDENTNQEHSIKVKLYKINNIATQCAVALQFENETNYYIYINTYYNPDTLGQFIQDLNLKNNISFSSNAIYEPLKDGKIVKTVEYEGVNSDVIWSILFSDTSAKNSYTDGDYHPNLLRISITNPLSKFNRYEIKLSSDGYLETNILETVKSFYIGEEKTYKFMDYLTKNCESHEIVYVDTNTEKNEQIMMQDVTNNTITEVRTNTISNGNYIEAYNPEY